MHTPLTVVFSMMVFVAGPALAADPATAKPAAPAAAPAAAAPAPAPAAAPLPERQKIDWKAMDKKQRKAHMKKFVQPEMQKIFAELDAKKYKKIKCTLCHGSGVNKAYEMPNAELPKLPSDEAGFKALSAKKPEVMKFMGTRVKPAMAALLGMDEMTQTNPAGFGCFNCHVKEGPAPAAAPKVEAPKTPPPATPAPKPPTPPAPAK